jgi:CRISPR/Cas system CMR-associated protein Cmr5 small subunit
MDKNERDLQVTRLHIQFVQKALADLRQVEQSFNGYIRKAPLIEIYRGLRSSKANKSATDILVHTENITREIEELERSLHNGETILKQQAQYYERLTKTPS